MNENNMFTITNTLVGFKLEVKGQEDILKIVNCATVHYPWEAEGP